MKQFDNRNLIASHGLYKHNLSHRNAFTTHFGMLLPFLVQDVVGNSRVRLSLEHQTRALPLNQASFVRLREHYDYFFVPYSQLFRQYDNFKTMQSNQSSMLDKNAFPTIVSRIPTFTKTSLDTVLQINNSVDAAGYAKAEGASRLLDLCVYGNYKAYNPASESLPAFNLYPDLDYNPFRLLAYQKIYYDYFRNDKYETNETGYYNIDDITNGVVDAARLRLLTTLHYRWRRKDYFTQVTPDLLPTTYQFNRSGFPSALSNSTDVSGIPSSQFSLPGAGVTATDDFVAANIGIGNPDLLSSSIDAKAGSNVRTRNSVSTNNILQSNIQHRLIESRQRLLERMYAAKSDFSSQMLAIYGYAPIEGRHGKVKHIGGFSELLNVTDVNNTTPGYQSSDSGTFGKINNYGSSKDINFHVPEDGIIMGIYSTDCMPDYSSRRVDRFNFKKVPEDYHNPYYEGLGKQALFAPEYSIFEYNGAQDAYVATDARVLGFIPRYAEYKSRVDEVHGELDFGGVFENYTSAFNVDMLDTHKVLCAQYMINKPLQLNGIFYVDFNGKQSTDCFLCNFYNNVRVLAPIKRNSEL